MMSWTEFQQRFSASRRLSPETVRGYFADLELFLAYWADREPLAGPHDVQKKHLADWFLAMKKRTGVSEATAGARMRSVLVLLRWAVRQQILLIDPSQGLKVHKPSRPIPRILTQSEVSHLLQAPLQKNRFFTKLRDRAILELLYATGMRGGELLALNVQDLELADASLQILTGKGKNRRLPLTEPAVRALREYLDWILPRYAQKWRIRSLSHDCGRAADHHEFAFADRPIRQAAGHRGGDRPRFSPGAGHPSVAKRRGTGADSTFAGP